MTKQLKLFSLIALASVMFFVFSVSTASAFESTFGGYWRTRIYQQSKFSTDDTDTQDATKTDTRTRLYYTAKFSDNLKFVNKFEFNSTWGDTDGGDIGADGSNWKVKNSYIDLNLNNFAAKVGTQGITLNRGFAFSDDFSGAVLSYNFGVPVTFVWMKNYEGGVGKDANDEDLDTYGLTTSFSVMPDVTISPILYLISSKANADYYVPNDPATNNELGMQMYGFDFDGKFGPASAWATFLMQSGKITPDTGSDIKLKGSLMALGGNYALNQALSFRAQFFTATGDDDTSDSDAEAFVSPKGASYYWAEIMGCGTFDSQVSAGAAGDKINNITAFNVGGTYVVSDKLKLALDIWSAAKAEVGKDADGKDNKELMGTEIDLKATYKIVDNLNLDFVLAQLSSSDGDEDPMEVGTMLSFSF